MVQARTTKGRSPTGYRVRARCCGNPDLGQFSPPGDDLDARVQSVEDAVRAYLRWQKLWNLGSGNMEPVTVTDGRGRTVGRISYNGRLWNGDQLVREVTQADRDAAAAMLQTTLGLEQDDPKAVTP